MSLDIRLVTGAGAEQCSVDDLSELLDRGDGLVWVDLPDCDEEAVRGLSDAFCFHPMAVRDCVERNRVPKVHAYDDHVFVVLHAPEPGERGHVHYVELDQFVGRNFLVTVHGPLNPAVDTSVALRETRDVLQRIEASRLTPETSFELSYAIVSALARHQEGLRRDADRRRVGARATGDRREDLRSGGVPQRAVPGPPRAARGAHHGCAQQHQLRTHGHPGPGDAGGAPACKE